jgi:arabinofuranosyltransferase
LAQTSIKLKNKNTLQRLPELFLLTSVVLLIWRVYQFNMPDVMVDDTFISFRYARNLANNLGLVFNPGERVEGYTNFLWVVILAVSQALGLKISMVSKIYAAAATLGTLLLIYFLARKLFASYQHEYVFVALPILVFVCQGTQARYVVSGMETALFTFLLTLSVTLMLFDPKPWLAGLSFALTAMTRPEGVMYFGIAAAALVVHNWLRNRSWDALKPVLGMVLVFVVVYGSYFLWRYSYFGYLLPNTFYAKASGFQWDRLTRGWGVLLELLSWWRIYLLLGLALLSIISWRRNWAWPLFATMMAATFVYFIYVGGDFTVWFGPRFLMPVLPMLLLLASEGLARISEIKIPLQIVSVIQIALIVGLLVIAYGYSWPDPEVLELYFNPQMRAWAEMGRWIEANTPADYSIATDAAGLIPYYSERYAIDMFGLTDVHIAHLELENLGQGTVAHEKTDPWYVLERRPDCIVSTWMDQEGNAVSSGLLSVKDEFSSLYALIAVAKSRQGPPQNDRWVIETSVYNPRLFENGYVTGLFCLK